MWPLFSFVSGRDRERARGGGSWPETNLAGSNPERSEERARGPGRAEGERTRQHKKG